MLFSSGEINEGGGGGDQNKIELNHFPLPLSNHLSTPSSLSHDENNMAAKTRKVLTPK